MTLPSEHPAKSHRLVLEPLPAVSTHGLPLANGLLGALIWHDGEGVVVSLDRADLWDLRDVPEYSGPSYTNDVLADLVEAGNMERIAAAFEAPYRRPAPTKLPAGRIRIGASRAATPGSLRLDVATATVGSEGGEWHAVIHAEREAGLIWGTGEPPPLVLLPPAFGQPRPADREPSLLSPFGPEDLDYPAPIPVSEPGTSGYVQALPDGRAFCALLGWHGREAGWRAAWSVSMASTAAAAEGEARHRVRLTLWDDHAGLVKSHEDWWNDYWSTGWLRVPDAVIERQWVLDAYKLGAAARADRPPVALQAQWTSDDGRLPPWKGDYHHDLNTQMTYWPCLTGNRLGAHAGFLEWLWSTREACRGWTRVFFGVEGLNVPMTADLGNRELGGWAPYTHSATTGAWLAHHFAEHWRMSGDDRFLHDRARPYVRECAVFLDALTRRDAAAGRRRLRLSSSPEIGDNRREAWFDQWSNYDLMLTRTLFSHAAAMAAAMSDTEDTRRWQVALGELPEPALDPNGAFAITPDMPFSQSHRHFSHQLAMHPLGQVAPDDPRVAATIASIDAAGTEMWMGYTFAWSAGLHALAGDGEAAAARLHQFARGFTASNSFHTNGEVGCDKLTRFNFDVFTLEGNCAAMAAVQDTMLQSRGDLIDVFPALPGGWEDCAFSRLLAEGGVIVDATLTGGELLVTLLAERVCTRRVRAYRGASKVVELRPGVPAHVEITRQTRRSA